MAATSTVATRSFTLNFIDHTSSPLTLPLSL